VSAPVETFQVTWELDHLVRVVADGRPHRILEVGCWRGGTLWHWLRQADVVVAVDDAMRNVEDWREWADAEPTELHTIQGDSQHSAIVELAREHGPYDFVFIDANHSYEAVRADVDNYGGMLADGGAIALHDILPRPGYGVSRVWAEIKAMEGARYMEIAKNAVEPGNEGPCGIGIVWLP
jgi:predicted O-methyltransferase YrrM